MMIACAHAETRTNGKDRHGNTRFRCKMCGKIWVEVKPVNLLGPMKVTVADAKLVLNLLTQRMSIRATERTSGMNGNTICKLIVFFGDVCRSFLDGRMQGLTLSHLEFDEQWTFVKKKQSRLTTTERAESSEAGDMYLWTCIDQKTKLMPSFLIGPGGCVTWGAWRILTRYALLRTRFRTYG